MVSACWRAKLWSRDWKTDSWVWKELRWVERREAPWVAYDSERESRFWKAERPTPRRVVISEGYCLRTKLMKCYIDEDNDQ